MRKPKKYDYELSHLFWINKDCLKEREREIVDRRLRGQTFKKIGASVRRMTPQQKATGMIGISAERVKQIFDWACRKLRRRESRRAFKEF